MSATCRANLDALARRAISQPLVTHPYRGSVGARVRGRLYYPSHDIDGGAPFDDDGGHFCMEDYHVLRQDARPTVRPRIAAVLHVRDVPWAERRCGRQRRASR